MDLTMSDSGRLVITRKTGEAVFIGDNIKITILGPATTEIRLMIEAPRDIPIVREEIRGIPPETFHKHVKSME